jgi:hypothetical protein
MLTDGLIEQVDNKSIKGHRISRGWANDQQVFFHTEFSKEIEQFEMIAKMNGREVTARIKF